MHRPTRFVCSIWIAICYLFGVSRIPKAKKGVSERKVSVTKTNLEKEAIDQVVLPLHWQARPKIIIRSRQREPAKSQKRKRKESTDKQVPKQPIGSFLLCHGQENTADNPLPASLSLSSLHFLSCSWQMQMWGLSPLVTAGFYYSVIFRLRGAFATRDPDWLKAGGYASLGLFLHIHARRQKLSFSLLFTLPRKIITAIYFGERPSTKFRILIINKFLIKLINM